MSISLFTFFSFKPKLETVETVEWHLSISEDDKSRINISKSCLLLALYCIQQYPHIMSRGGYELIEEKMMQEKIKQRQESAGDSIPTPPSPPKRHEKWIRGRT